MGFFIRECYLDHLDNAPVLTENAITVWIANKYKGYSDDQIADIKSNVTKLDSAEECDKMIAQCNITLEGIKRMDSESGLATFMRGGLISVRARVTL